MAQRQAVQGCVDASRPVRDASQLQAHLHAAQRACQHQIVKVSQVPDAKNLASQFGQSGAQ